MRAISVYSAALVLTGFATLAAVGGAGGAVESGSTTPISSSTSVASSVDWQPVNQGPAVAGGVRHPLEVRVVSGTGGSVPAVGTVPSGYTPATMKSLLGLTGTGKGQTIAIVVAYDSPTIANDLAVFDRTYGLPAPPSFKKVNQSGGTKYPAVDPGWALEAALDVEWAHALAPAAGILLIEATNSSMNNLNAAIDYAAKQKAVRVISNSWGTSGEISGEATNDYHCKLANALCIFSSGDNGWPGGYPAYSPYVLAVGGTTLTTTTDATGAVTVSSEDSWADTGGGVSQYEPKPSYQAAVNPYAGRGIPDVSYDADPVTGFAVYDTTPYDGASGWFQVGGTSAGAPQWAAIMAAAGELRAAKGKPVLGAFKSPNFPAATAIYSSGVRAAIADITTGPSNGSCGAVCSIAPGYDFLTGLGSPRQGIDAALAAA